ncbi:MAG TPA: 2Fe-2S iron-sulfur cluster-binding protein [Solimonas sp.]
MAVTVHFVQDDGAEKVVSGEVGETLMEVGREQNVAGILGDCGGGASCATCHVYVDPQWQARTGKADDVELATLDMVSDILRDSSRLSCQIVLRDELDGLRVTVAPSV